VRGPRVDTRLAFLAAIETGTSYRLLSLVALRPQELRAAEAQSAHTFSNTAAAAGRHMTFWQRKVP